MKRFIFSISLALSLFSLQAFASDGNTPDVLNIFYKKFRTAENVNWSTVDDMLRIGFTSNGRQQYAYYSNDDLVVLATEIKEEELPADMKQQLHEDYKEFTVSRVYELTRNNLKEYCVVIDGANRHITLKGKSKLKFCFDERK